jgi:hypothetical protein
MGRTPEQVQADAALTAAVQAAAVLYGWAPDAVVTDYLVVLSAITYDETGEWSTDEGVMMRDGHLPEYRALGLAEYAVAALVDRDLLDEYVPYEDDGDEA